MLVVVLLFLLWPKLQPIVWDMQRSWGSPKGAVSADLAQVNAARARQQQALLAASQKRAEARSAKKRAEALGEKPSPKKPVKQGAQLKPFGNPGSGGFGNGGAGGGRNPLSPSGGGSSYRRARPKRGG